MLTKQIFRTYKELFFYLADRITAQTVSRDGRQCNAGHYSSSEAMKSGQRQLSGKEISLTFSRSFVPILKILNSNETQWF
jgi:hypothetical protein